MCNKVKPALQHFVQSALIDAQNDFAEIIGCHKSLSIPAPSGADFLMVE